MKQIFKMLNQKGFSLLEVIIALGILGAASTYMMTSYHSSQQGIMGLSDKTILNTVIWDVVTGVDGNVGKYQTNFSSNEIFSQSSSASELNKILPIAWDSSGTHSLEDCPKCKGRMGYIIKPLSGQRGLFELDIKVTHERIFPNSYRTYIFLVKGK